MQLVQSGVCSELTKVLISDVSARHATIAAMALSNLLDLDDTLEDDHEAIEKLISTVGL